MNAMNGKNRETRDEERIDSARVRWGILGTGKIAGKFASELKRPEASRGSVAHAVASRDPERARNFACEHGIPHACGSYDELLERQDVDVVYIGLVNSQHYPVCKRALLAGKPVLCEKPFTLHPEETRELIALYVNGDSSSWRDSGADVSRSLGKCAILSGAVNMAP